jgi:hypothetical protein
MHHRLAVSKTIQGHVSDTFVTLEIVISPPWKRSAVFAARSSLWEKNPAVRRHVDLILGRGSLAALLQSPLVRLLTLAALQRQLHVNLPRSRALALSTGALLPRFPPAPMLVAVTKLRNWSLLQCVPTTLATTKRHAALLVLRRAVARRKR